MPGREVRPVWLVKAYDDGDAHAVGSVCQFFVDADRPATPPNWIEARGQSVPTIDYPYLAAAINADPNSEFFCVPDYSGKLFFDVTTEGVEEVLNEYRVGPWILKMSR